MKYQPSNGTEGDIFTGKYCMNCVHCDPNPEGKKQCEILMCALSFNVDEEEYPIEWIYLDNVPTCTKWEKWDWEKYGNPDKYNKKPVVKVDPNQTKLF